MADLGNLYFGVHLKDYTDAEADKVKKKLENLSVSLKIDGNNITVANTDAIKKQIEAAVKSVSIPSVSVDANAVKQQVDTAFKTATPQVSVTLLKGNLDKDIQTYLSSKTYDIKISISSQQAQSQIKNLGSVTITAKLKLDKKAAIDALKKSLQNSSVPIGVRMKSAKDLANDIRTKMQNIPIKVNIDANKNILTSNIKQALKNQTFKADLKLNIQTVDVQQAIRDAFAKAGLAYNTTASNVRAALINTRQQKADAYVDAQKALADLRRAQIASAQAATQHKNAMQGVNDVASKQKSLMTQLAQKIADLYSVVRIGDFVANMVRIGGEFEQQKVALGTIVGDASKAGALFERIKNLAVESPYKFGDLAAYSKQLAAFGIEYNELYDTLKRFGDISAGLGVDMQRIILAFGQVKSAEFLKGTELRQFTEAGIPLVSELARRYTELEGSLVSVGDVFDRISKKEVPFEDVRAVLWDLTNEGGRFYEMQAVLTDTLKGKLDKLVDSYEIFLSKIADSNYSIIGGTLDLLAEILKHWKEIEKAVKVAVSAYGAYKAALISIVAIQKIAHNVEAVYRLGRSMIFLGKAVNGVDAVFKMLKATLMRHPIGLIATAVSALVGTLALLSGEERNVAEEVDSLNAKLATELDLIEQQKSKAGDLASIMSGIKNSIQSRNRAYSGLLAIYPNLFVGMSQEQALLLSELDIRERIAGAAKKEAREKLQADLAVNRNKLSGLQTELEGFKIQKNWRISKGYGKDNAEKWFNEATKKLRGDIALVETAINNTEIELLKLDQVASDAAARKGERWYKDAEAYVTSLGEKFKDLMPKDSEDRDSYFSRIGNAVSSLKNKIGELNPELESAKELLDGEDGLNAEYKVTKHIYTKILGGKDEDFDKLLKERQDLEKKREKEVKEAGERAAKMFADGVKEGIDKAVRQWDLYKQLFELTGDKEFAMTAFSITPIWDEAANQMYEEFEKAAESQGFTGAISFGISDALAKETFGELYDSWKEIKDRIEKNGIDLKVNTANAIREAKDFEAQIEQIERELHEKLELIGKSGLSSEAIGRLTQSLITNAERAIATVEFDKFKKEIGYTQFFANLEHQGSSAIIAMRDAMLKFGDSANLTHEEMTQIADDIERMMDVLVKNHPFKAIDEAVAMNGKFREEYKLASENFKKDPSLSNANILASAKANLDMAGQMMIDAMSEIQSKFEELSNVVSGLSSMFEKFGNTGLKHFAEALESASNGMSTGTGAGKFIGGLFGQGGAGGIVGGFIGAAAGAMAGLVDAGRKAVEAEQERSQIVVDRLEKVASLLKDRIAESLTGLYNSTLDATSRMEMERKKAEYEEAGKKVQDKHGSIDPNAWYGMTFDKTTFPWDTNDYLVYSKKTHDAINEALRMDNEFMATYASMLAQRDELMYQKATYTDKDSDKVDAYKRDKQLEIEELNAEIEKLAKDMLSSLYNVDFKDWASQLADSIVNAWANGEDAAKAYEATVSDILRNVATSMIQQKILGDYFADNIDPWVKDFIASGGVMTDELYYRLAGIVDGGMERMDQAEEALDAWEKVLNERGMSLKDNKSESSSLSKGIQSVTEDTANLLGSYLNSIRADVSVQRTLIEQLVSVDVPQMSIIAQAQLQQLQQVVANTKRNADAADSIREALSSVIGIGKNGKAIKIV